MGRSLVPVAFDPHKGCENKFDQPIEDGEEVRLYFSPDGNYLVIHLRRKHKIRIYDISNKKMETDEDALKRVLFELNHYKEIALQEGEQQLLEGLQTLKFDQSPSNPSLPTKYLLGFDSDKLVIMDI
jgi:hypothetical protein